jgi:hypothetical protein
MDCAVGQLGIGIGVTACEKLGMGEVSEGLVDSGRFNMVAVNAAAFGGSVGGVIVSEAAVNVQSNEVGISADGELVLTSGTLNFTIPMEIIAASQSVVRASASVFV